MNRYLIVGLGNPGIEYQDTRHNIGFLIADALCLKLNGRFNEVRHGSMASCQYKGRSLIILKPSTFMNLSGTAVQFWMQKESIKTEHILVIVDELALPFGTLRLGPKGSDGGHNGLHHIQQVLNTTQYPRLRVGIGSDYAKGQQVSYVLGKWNAQENEQLPDLIQTSVDGILQFTFIGIERTMNTLNKRL